MVYFNELSNDEKAVLIWYNSDFVMTRFTQTTRFNLFSLSGIFIEIQFDRRTNDLKEIAVLDVHMLDRYTKGIDLAMLIANR